MSILERIKAAEESIRSAGWNAPPGYDNFKSQCWQAGDALLAAASEIARLSVAMREAIEDAQLIDNTPAEAEEVRRDLLAVLDGEPH